MRKYSGYVSKACSGHPKTHANGCVYEHILIAEKLLGRYLNSDEVVHHKDENKTNNLPENLMIFNNDSSHKIFHQAKNNCNLIEIEPNVFETKIQIVCKYCNTKFDSKVSNQEYCSRKCSYLNKRIVEQPSRNELKDLIRSNAFTTLSIMFNVSDNAIRKWCKKYDLPFKSSDIKNYSKSEWELI